MKRGKSAAYMRALRRRFRLGEFAKRGSGKRLRARKARASARSRRARGASSAREGGSLAPLFPIAAPAGSGSRGFTFGAPARSQSSQTSARDNSGRRVIS